MPKFEGTFESPIVSVRGPFTSLVALTSSEAEGISALQTTPDGAQNVLLSLSSNGSQSPPTEFLFEQYEDVENTYSVLLREAFSNNHIFVPLKSNNQTSPFLPYHWRFKVVQGSPLRTVFANFQYI
jgi:hypothetical protein